MGQRAFGMHRIGVVVSAQRSLRYSLLAIWFCTTASFNLQPLERLK